MNLRKENHLDGNTDQKDQDLEAKEMIGIKGGPEAEMIQETGTGTGTEGMTINRGQLIRKETWEEAVAMTEERWISQLEEREWDTRTRESMEEADEEIEADKIRVSRAIEVLVLVKVGRIPSPILEEIANLRIGREETIEEKEVNIEYASIFVFLKVNLYCLKNLPIYIVFKLIF